MDLCQEIERAECCAGEIAHEYAVACTFGNHTDKKLYEMLRLMCYIRTLKRCITTYRKVKIPLQGQTVSFSSLKKQNNTLILGTEHLKCSTIEVRPCLSDEEICKIVELVQIMCYACKTCN